MPGLRAELRLENVSDSPLGAVSEVMQEPVTPLSLTLLEYILNGDLSSIHEYGYNELATPFGVDARQRYDLQSSTTKPAYQYVNDRIESLSDIYAADGDLYLSLDVESRSELRDLCADIEERYGQVSVERITNIESVSEKASHRLQTEVNRGRTRPARVVTYEKFIRRPVKHAEDIVSKSLPPKTPSDVNRGYRPECSYTEG
jgi:hypothetical protein